MPNISQQISTYIWDSFPLVFLPRTSGCLHEFYLNWLQCGGERVSYEHDLSLFKICTQPIFIKKLIKTGRCMAVCLTCFQNNLTKPVRLQNPCECMLLPFLSSTVLKKVRKWMPNCCNNYTYNTVFKKWYMARYHTFKTMALSLKLLPRLEQTMQFWIVTLKLYVELKVSGCFGSTGVKFISLPDFSKISRNLQTVTWLLKCSFLSTAHSLT